MSAVLYINTKGQAYRRHSYSMGLEFDRCPFSFYLKRIVGWREKDDRASFMFGRALEQAIQFHHDNDGKSGIEKFSELWSQFKDAKLKYTHVEKDWETLNRSGQEMMKLYIIRQPSLPIPLGGGSVFQREYSKIVFDGDPKFGDIEFIGKLDIVAYVDPAHPELPAVHWKPEYGLLRPIIIDIKTSAVDLPERPGLAAFDKQLRVYSWLTGIRDAGLLWFKKCGHNLSKGSSITLLEDAGNYKAGVEAVIAQVVDDKVWLLPNDFMLEEMNKAQGRKEDGAIDQTKAAKQRKAEWLEQNGVLVSESTVTRQRLQFNCGFISIESANDAGVIAADQIIRIANAWEKKQYPVNFGIRFPSNDLGDPYFRAFVLKDENFKEEYFKQVDSEEIDDLFRDDAESEGVE